MLHYNSLIPFLSFISLLLGVPSIYALTPCPLLGPDFFPPTKLSTSPIFTSALSLLQQQLDTIVLLNSTPSVSFSIAAFSATEPGSLFEYHHTADAIKNSSVGVTTVDSDTVYRIASISKVFTVYALLIEGGEHVWNDPVTKYLPELKSAAASGNASDSHSAVDHTAWDDITLGALASQMAGIGRDSSQLGLDVTNRASLGSMFTQLGLPPLDEIPAPPCGTNKSIPFCGKSKFLTDMANRAPTFAPSTTPVYSNAGFQILALALESLTRKDYATLLEDDIIKPLNLSRTSLTQPDDSEGIIPSDPTSSLWAYDESGGADSAGGAAGQMYSSLTDLRKLGQGILSNKLLTPVQTRRWMKPLTFTAENYTAVGAPWEIFRVSGEGVKIVDWYSKGGALGSYRSQLFLAPDYEAGFVILVAGSSGSSPAEDVLTNAVGETLNVALEAAARAETKAVFAGTYEYSDLETLNSSITFAMEEGKPGLVVTSWTSKGVDLLTVLPQVLVGTPSVDTRLYPTNLVDEKTKQIQFRAVFGLPDQDALAGPFVSGCISWEAVDSFVYGGVSLDEFVFTLGDNGTAVSVEPSILRTTLARVA